MNEHDKINNMGLVIALGAGVGMIFGEFLFDNVGVGIAIVVGLGLAFNLFSRIK